MLHAIAHEPVKVLEERVVLDAAGDVVAPLALGVDAPHRGALLAAVEARQAAAASDLLLYPADAKSPASLETP